MDKIFSNIAFLLLITACNPSEKMIYVSSNGRIEGQEKNQIVVNSIDEALLKVLEIRAKNIDIPITIFIEPGEYRLNEPLKITPKMGNLKIVGVDSDQTVFKGSMILNLNWVKYTDSIWRTSIDKNEHFDQLFINGKKQILARYPNYNESGGHWQGHAPDAIAPDRVKSWQNPEGAIVNAMHEGEWGGFHYIIKKVNDDGSVELSGGHQNNRPSKMHEKYRMVENVFEELDSPNEWFLDKEKNELYYWPDKMTNLNETQVEGVGSKHLIEIIGSENNPVKNISISGIGFEHTRRTIMEQYEPLLRSDWNIYRGGAIFIEGSENINIEDCEFSNLGGNVIFVSNYNRNVKISGNHIHDNGASAISFVGSASAVRSPSFQYDEFIPLSKIDTVRGPANNEYPSNCIVDDNLIYRIGRTEKQTSGVQISMAMNITVSNNSIYDVPRSGINISEGTWGGHIIEYNDVFNTVLETSDHGAFNSWGRDRFWHPNRSTMDKIISDNPEMPYWDAIKTTIIRNNRFRCDHGWDIDLDDGSSNYKVYNNVCLKGGIKLREGFYRTVENNIMINNSFHPHVWFKNSGDIFRKNIVMNDYKDIRLSGWGKEIDYNLFPNKKALEKAQKNGVDNHSIFGNPEFLNAEEAIYTVSDNSPALKIGFVNFPMDNFGVKKPSLKAIAKTPDIPTLWSISDPKNKKSMTIELLGGTFKNIESLEERSAFGLLKTSGVMVMEIEKESVLDYYDLQIGDVIVAGENEEINNIPDLMNIYEGNNWKGKLNLTVYRNQKPIELIIPTKK